MIVPQKYVRCSLRLKKKIVKKSVKYCKCQDFTEKNSLLSVVGRNHSILEERALQNEYRKVAPKVYEYVRNYL